MEWLLFLAGILVGVVGEWLIDVFYWRKKRVAWAEKEAVLHADVAAAQAETDTLRTDVVTARAETDALRADAPTRRRFEMRRTLCDPSWQLRRTARSSWRWPMCRATISPS
jgi:hypothetical protein